jgi:hypothetical protein
MARNRQPEPPIEAQHVQAECFLLCDFARAENRKLYIVGGGWDQIVPQRLPLDHVAYLATKLVLPGELLGEPVVLRIELLDKNGQVLGEPVYESILESGPADLPIEIAERELLRLVVFMGNEVKMTLREPGLFTLRLLVNAQAIAETKFTVTPAHSEFASS